MPAIFLVLERVLEVGQQRRLPRLAPGHQLVVRFVPFLAMPAICLGLERVLEVGQQRRLLRLALGQQLVVRVVPFLAMLAPLFACIYL